MLNFFRRGGVGQIIVAAIVFAIIVVFVIEFRAGGGTTGQLTRQCAVEFEGECIERKEFFAALGLVATRDLTPKRMQAMNLRQQVLDGLAERELLLEEAERLGISVSDEDLDAELAKGRAHVSLPTNMASWMAYSLGLDATELVRYLPVRSQQTQEFDYKIYERVVRNITNRSPREFREMQRRELIAARMRALVASRVRISEAEAYRRFEREKSKAVVRTVELNRDWFAKYVVDSSHEAVEAWLKENAAQVEEAWKNESKSFVAGCPLVREVFVAAEPGATDADKVLARDRAESAKQRIANGEAFGSVARALGEGPAAIIGGELGCLGDSYGVGSKELLEATKALKAGEVSAVVETPRGFHVVQLLGTLGPDAVENTGKKLLATRLHARLRADELAQKFATELIEKVQAGARLEETTRAMVEQSLAAGKKSKPGSRKASGGEQPPALDDPLRPKVEISAPFGPGANPLPRALPTENVAALAFGLKDADAVVPRPITTSTGWAVLQLKEKEEAQREEFLKDKAELMRQLRQAKEQEAVGRYVAQLRKAAQNKLKMDAELLVEPKRTDEQGT